MRANILKINGVVLIDIGDVARINSGRICVCILIKVNVRALRTSEL